MASLKEKAKGNTRNVVSRMEMSALMSSPSFPIDGRCRKTAEHSHAMYTE